MWLVLLVVVLLLAVQFLAYFALHPLEALTKTIRILLFFLGVGLLIVWATTREEVPVASQRELFLLIGVVFGAWVLTFVIPELTRHLLHRRRQQPE